MQLFTRRKQTKNDPNEVRMITRGGTRRLHVARLRDPLGELDGVGDGRGEEDVAYRVRQ